MSIGRFYPFLTFLVILISGNPAIEILGQGLVYIGTFIIFFSFWYFKPSRITPRDLCIFLLFTSLVLAHLLIYGLIVVNASLGFLIKLSIALLAVRIIPDFQRRCIRIMVILSSISLILFIPSILNVNLTELLSAFKLPLSGYYHIGLYNLRTEEDGTLRNSGMFWEPGAFAGYLILALLFLMSNISAYTYADKRKYSFILVTTLLSTQSTSGYLALVIMLTFVMLKFNIIKNKSLKILIIPFILLTFAAVFYVAFDKFSFLGEKISDQILEVLQGEDTGRINRFGNFLYDWEWISERPIFGWSATPVTRQSFDSEVLDLIAVQGNGLTGFVVKFGLFGFFSFLWFFSKATRYVSKSAAVQWFGVGLICLLLNGEQFLSYPLFLSLMFLPNVNHINHHAFGRSHRQSVKL